MPQKKKQETQEKAAQKTPASKSEQTKDSKPKGAQAKAAQPASAKQPVSQQPAGVSGASKPPANPAQPAVGSGQPATAPSQPTQGPAKPAAGPAQPATAPGQPAASPGQPATAPGFGQAPVTSVDAKAAGTYGYGTKKGKIRQKPTISVFWKGFLGGLCGAVIVCALAFAIDGSGILRSVGLGSTKTEESAAGNVIDLNHVDADASTAEVVAAKCLPSVATINVTTSQSSGVGSGVVLDSDGHLVTNYHVINGATTITATLNNQTYNAAVVGFDESSDLAVLKINADASSLTPASLGDSSKLVVGEWVMSIGSPFGLDQSVSQGIVSSLYRSTMLQDSDQNTIYTNLIQTDAAINPGNSGGALVNAEGELVGINSIIESSSGSSSGVGFAIPSNYVKEVTDTILAGKQVEHAYLGANVMSVTAQLTTRYNLGVNQGAYIDSVVQGSPAAAAGLAQGDVITKVDDEEVSSGDGLILAVRSHHVGDTVTITYYRGGSEHTVQVTLGTDTSAAAQQNAQSNSNAQQNQNSNSLSVNPFDLLNQFLQ